MRRCLVVANQTLDSPRLEDAMRDEASHGATAFHLVVPLTDRTERLTWTEGEVRTSALARLDQALVRFLTAGLAVDGEVGGMSPVDSITDVILRDGPDVYALVLVSTFPHHLSRWLRLDAPRRIRAATGLPVRHVEAPIPTSA